MVTDENFLDFFLNVWLKKHLHFCQVSRGMRKGHKSNDFNQKLNKKTKLILVDNYYKY